MLLLFCSCYKQSTGDQQWQEQGAAEEWGDSRGRRGAKAGSTEREELGEEQLGRRPCFLFIII